MAESDDNSILSSIPPPSYTLLNNSQPILINPIAIVDVFDFDGNSQEIDVVANPWNRPCNLPLSFWFFILGFFFPPLWILGTFAAYSEVNEDLTWAKVCFFASILFLMFSFSIYAEYFI